MAITIYNTPNSYAPVYNQMIFTLSSTNVAQSNFRYIADIYVNGSSDYTRLEVGRNPSNNNGTFDVAGIIQNFLTRDFEDNTTTFKQCVNSIASYIVQFGEQYGPSSGITNYPNLTTSSGYCFNGVFSPLDFLDFQTNTYVLQNTSSQFLTDRPTFVSRTGEKLILGFMTDAANEAYNLEVISYYDDSVTTTDQNGNSFQETRRNYKLDKLAYTDTLTSVKDGRTLDLNDKIATQDGSLYQITPQSDEIFVSGTTVNDIQVIDSLTASELKATNISSS
jgi:hypothetical protein